MSDHTTRRKSTTIEERFWTKVDKRSPAHCWEWQGAVTTKGYGMLAYQGRNVYAHRLVLELSGITIPDGMMACHHCDNRRCCNPAHIFLGTAKDNSADMVRKGRNHQYHDYGPKRAKLTESDVIAIRKMRAAGATYGKIAREFEIGRTTARNIAIGRNWRHVQSGGE